MALGQIDGANVVVFVGGVGGAKLALGYQQIVAPERLTIIVNTGDDFWHYGLKICPDLDTVLYTLSGRVDPVNGWGVAGDTITTLETLRELGDEAWFRLGDKDIATHLLRTHLLREGHSLTAITRQLSRAMGIQATILPMTDHPMPTIITTEEYGDLAFQEYFVRYRWQPTVKQLHYSNAAEATLSNDVQDAIQTADVIVFGPSNPWLSIAPILAVPQMHDRIKSRAIPRIGVTPIIQKQAVKGPAAKLMAELGYDVSASSVAAYYASVLNGFVYDERDEDFNAKGLHTVAMDTMMITNEDKAMLARSILQWASQWELK